MSLPHTQLHDDATLTLEGEAELRAQDQQDYLDLRAAVRIPPGANDILEVLSNE